MEEDHPIDEPGADERRGDFPTTLDEQAGDTAFGEERQGVGQSLRPLRREKLDPNA